jgi:Tol biopolymer transport system component
MTTATTSTTKPWFRNHYVLGTIGLTTLFVLGVLMALQPDRPGTLRTEIVDSMVELTLKGTSHRFVTSDTQPLTLAPGEKSFLVKRGGLQFEITGVPIASNAETVLRAETIDNYLTIKANDKIVAEKLLPTDSSLSSTDSVAGSAKIPPGTAAAADRRFALRILPLSYVEIPTLRRENSEPMTIEMWVEAPRTRGVLFSMEGKPGVQFSCDPGPESVGFFDVLERTRNGETALHIPLQWPNRKRHLATVWENGKSVLFVDGKAMATGEAVPAEEAGEIPPGNSSVTMIGSQMFGSDRGYHCSGGTFYCLRVSSTARYRQDFIPTESFATDDKTIALYTFDEGKGQTLKDASGHNHHGTIVGAQWVTPDEPVLTKEAGEVKAGDPSVVDLLAAINPAADTWLGECRRDGETLLLGKDGSPTRVQINRNVPEEYLLVAEIERISGTDGIQFGLVIDGQPVSFVIDCFRSTITGLGLVGGKHADDNLTTSHGRRLVNGQRHTVVIHVKKEGILASLDGRYLLEWKGAPADLMLPNYESPPNKSQLWFGTAYVPVRLHSLRMKSLRDAADPALSSEPPWPYDPADGVSYVWSEPENAGPVINTAFFDEHPEASPNDLSLWLSGGGELWISQRNSLQEPFGPRINAGAAINHAGAWDSEPSLTADGLQLFFCSDRDTTDKDMNLWSCTRGSLSDPWSPAVRLNSEVNSLGWDLCPAVSADGKTLLFSSGREGGQGNSDIWLASRSTTSDEFSGVINLGPEINSPGDERDAFLSNDGLTLLFSSRRRGSRGKHDLYYATRPASNVPFGKAISIGGVVNTVSDENGPCLSESGRAIYFYSDRPGGLGYADIWISRRVPGTKP